MAKKVSKRKTRRMNRLLLTGSPEYVRPHDYGQRNWHNSTGSDRAAFKQKLTSNSYTARHNLGK